MLTTKGLEQKEDEVTLSSLSKMTGFPSEFIKKELMLDKETLTISSLRESMLRYLDDNFKNEAAN